METCRDARAITCLVFADLIMTGVTVTCAKADESMRGQTPDTEANSRSAISGAVQLVTGAPGTALGFPNKLLVAIPILNMGTLDAANAEVTSVRLNSAAPLTPMTFPVALGTVPAQGKVVLNVGFDSSRLAQGTP